jgi:hypothetical protein
MGVLMDKKIMSILPVLILLFLSTPYALFYDDYQEYNFVTNPYFTSNYSVNNSLNNLINSGNWTIASAGNVFLQYQNNNNSDFTIDIGAVNVNYSKIAASSSFNLNFSILSGSIVGSPVDNSYIMGISYFVNNTDSADKSLKSSRGYVVNYGLNDSSGLQFIELRRCSQDLNAPNSCGVQLAYSEFNLNYNTYIPPYSLTLGYIINNSIFFNLYYSPATNQLTIKIAGEPVLNHTDNTYTNGGFVIYSYHEHELAQSETTKLMLDNLSISGIATSAVSGWHIFSFPLNQDNNIGFGTLYNSSEICEGGDTLAGTAFGITFNPCIKWWADGAPSNATLLIPGFLMKYDGEWVTPYWETTHSFTFNGFGFYAAHENNCWIESGSSNDFPISADPNGWASSAPKKYTLNIDGVSQNSYPNLYLDYQIYCLSPENLTAVFYVTYDSIVEIFTLPVPIGYKIYPNGSVNYSLAPVGVWLDNSYVTNANVSAAGAINQNIEPAAMVNLLLQPWVIAFFLIIGMGILASQAGGPIMGIAGLMGGFLIMIVLGLLPVWIAIVILIPVAFIAAKQVQGVFTPSGSGGGI